MQIITCVKRVPDVADIDLEIAPDDREIRSDDLVYGINEWDNFAVEEAIRLREAHGGSVTAVTVGDEESEEVLRRALAMGADEAIRLSIPADLQPDGYAVARVLSQAISDRPFDLILTGSVSGDSGEGLVGGTLAALLDIPQVALATSIEVEGRLARVRHEVEGGLERIVELDLPALVTVQTGINEPRYVSIRGIRKVARVEIPVIEIDLDPPEVRVQIDELFLPQTDKRAEILEGDIEDVVDQLVEKLKETVGI